MSNTPQNIYGINNSADAYYGTLFSHLSYGMGEGNGVNSATTPNAENAAAAAAAAALAAVASGRNDWSNTDGYNAVSNMMNNMRTHPSMTACSNSGDLSESCNIPSSSLSSPYAATLLAAVAAAAAAAYPLPQGAANAVSGQTGRSFLPNPSMNNRAADFTTMYFGSSTRPSVTNANQLNGLLGNLPNWPFTVPPTHYPNSSFIDRPTGAVVPFEGWASSNGQQLTLSPCGENDTINHFGQGPSEANMPSKDPHTYYTSSNIGDAVFAPPASYSQQQQQCTTEDPGVSFIYHHPNSKAAYPFSSQGPQSHLVNGLPGSAANMLDPYASVNQCQTISQHLIDEFGRLNVGCGVETATCSDNGLNQLHVPFYETSVVGNGSNVQLHNTSVTQWSHMKENNGISNSMCSMDKSDNISRSQSNPSSYPASRLSTSASNRPATSVIATSVNNSPRTKTWANIAGQPPKGSAAVIQNSVGWSAKRSHPHNPTAVNRSFQTSTGNYSVGRANSLMANASCNNGHLTQQDRVNTADQSGNVRSLAESNSELKSTSNNGNHSADNSTSLLTSDGSAQAFQRESEALHQRLAKVINPNDFDTHIEKARFFVIKSFSEDDIHRSIKYSIWCSTELGNKKLDTAFAEANHAYPIYLFFSVNGSGHFCGMAEMVSRVDYNARASVWAQDKWQGKFSVRWIFVKDVPNTALRHIRIETNDNKPVTHSRDTTELPLERGKQVMEVLATYSHTLSIFDDFFYYDQRERQEGFRRKEFNTRRG